MASRSSLFLNSHSKSQNSRDTHLLKGTKRHRPRQIATENFFLLPLLQMTHVTGKLPYLESSNDPFWKGTLTCNELPWQCPACSSLCPGGCCLGYCYLTCSSGQHCHQTEHHFRSPFCHWCLKLAIHFLLPFLLTSRTIRERGQYDAAQALRILVTCPRSHSYLVTWLVA